MKLTINELSYLNKLVLNDRNEEQTKEYMFQVSILKKILIVFREVDRSIGKNTCGQKGNYKKEL